MHRLRLRLRLSIRIFEVIAFAAACAVLAACGASGGDPTPAAELPSRGASGWQIDGETVHEPARTITFKNGELQIDEETNSTSDRLAGHPHVVGDSTFHTCEDSICRDGVVVLAPDEDLEERSVADAFVRRSTSPLGRTLWDMWFVTTAVGDRTGALAFAGSFDGHRWSRYPDNPILAPLAGVSSPWVQDEAGGDALYVITGDKIIRRVRE